LGYAQSADPLRIARCRAARVGLVRRATGGAAVLHGSDLTYAVAAPASELPAGLQGAYQLIAGALIEVLRSFGVDARRSVAPRRDGATARVFDCFLQPAGDEISAGPPPERKLVGSAQRRMGGAVLQHGSIRLSPDPPAVVQAAGLSRGAATSLSELGCFAEKEEIGRRLARELAQRLGLRLELDEASPEEREYALARMRSHSSDPLAPPAPLAEPPSRGLSAGR
jgi:lipoate-protein ligase A